MSVDHHICSTSIYLTSVFRNAALVQAQVFQTLIEICHTLSMFYELQALTVVPLGTQTLQSSYVVKADKCLRILRANWERSSYIVLYYHILAAFWTFMHMTSGCLPPHNSYGNHSSVMFIFLNPFSTKFLNPFRFLDYCTQLSPYYITFPFPTMGLEYQMIFICQLSLICISKRWKRQFRHTL